MVAHFFFIFKRARNEWQKTANTPKNIGLDKKKRTRQIHTYCTLIQSTTEHDGITSKNKHVNEKSTRIT